MKAEQYFKTSYIVEISTRSQMRVDADEIEKVIRGASEGKLIRVRQGIINPSYITHITEDKERKMKFLDDTKYPQDAQRRARGMEALADIFSEMPRLANGNAPKQIT